MLVVVAMVAVACGDDDDDDTTAGDTGTDNGQVADTGEVTVGIDAETDDVNASFFAYFPDTVKVHPGDTIVYESHFTGEPHSIAFGTVVQTAIDEFQKLTPEQLESEGPPPPELDAAFAKIPPMLPEGPGDAHQNSVNPCFVTTGEIPSDTTKPCPVTEPEPFTGEEVFYNSGFLPDGETFELTLADDIAPGTYEGFCTLHFTEMISTIEVVAEDTELPSADDVAEEGQTQEDEFVEALVSAKERAEGETTAGTIAAGGGDESVRAALLAEFLPAEAQVKAGDQITWNIIGPHTISFNAPEDARTLMVEDDDGLFHLAEKAVSPAGYEPPPPPEGEPEGPPPPVDGGTWDGTGFFSSGLQFGPSFLLKITRPGTYEYVCLIHPDMEGTLTVS